MSKLDSDIASIKEAVLNIKENMGKMEACVTKIDDRVKLVEINAEGTKTKVGTIALFQLAFATIASAISGYIASR
jgi:hypothetical protein